jgi:hypothetical protein
MGRSGNVHTQLAYKKKIYSGDTPGVWGPWTAVHFPNQEARDRFLRFVGTTQESGRGVEPLPDDGQEARVRWRPGHFLGLNDIAYAHGGRIAVTVAHHWLV